MNNAITLVLHPDKKKKKKKNNIMEDHQAASPDKAACGEMKRV